MASARRRKAGIDDHEEHFDESWLVSYADMMTLLVALFMVLFSISAVNTSKFESLQRSLQEAFSGKIFPGGQGIAETGGDDSAPKVGASDGVPSFVPLAEQKGKAAPEEGGGGPREGPQGRREGGARPGAVPQGQDEHHQGRPARPRAHRRPPLRLR